MPVEFQRAVTVEQLALPVTVQDNVHPIRGTAVRFTLAQQPQKVIGGGGIKPGWASQLSRQVQSHHGWAAVSLGAARLDGGAQGRQDAS